MLKIEASYHQERLWFIDQFEAGTLYPSSPVYHNIPLILEISGALRIDLLEQSIQRVIQRHGALRTQIVTGDNKPFQVLHQDVNFELSLLDLTNGAAAGIDSALARALEEAKRPFLLDKEPLVRGQLIRISDESFLLVIALHHIIADKYSLAILAHEIFTYYNAFLVNRTTTPRLPVLRIQYADFSRWQKELPEKTLKSLLIYWKRKLSGQLQALELPTNRPRAAVHTFQDASHPFSIPEEIWDKIKIFCKKEKITPFVFLLAVFKVLLYWYSGQDEIVVGTSAANRNQPGTEEIIGPIANLLPLRTHLSGAFTFCRLLRDLDRTVNDAYKYQALPFDKLVLGLNPGIDMSRTALFDVLFQYEESSLQAYIPPVEGMKIRGYETNLGWGKYDLNMLIQKQPPETGLHGILVYNADYYDGFTISRLISHYNNLLEKVLNEPEREISTYDFLMLEETQRLLINWNDTCADYPKEAAVHQLFETQVGLTPDRIAVVHEETCLTYRELDNRANQVAVYLRDTCKLQPNDLVCLLLDRSEDMLISMLGVLKAGGAYVPIDPGYPEKRINYILDDSKSRLMITRGEVLEKVNVSAASMGTIIDILALKRNMAVENPGHEARPEDTAYVIYTSGTTGYPKGCLISHRNVVRLFKNDRHPFDFISRDIWIMAHSYCFDFSVWEIYGAVLNGGRLIIPGRDAVRDTGAFLSILKQYQVTVLNQTPAAFYQLIEMEKNSSRKRLNSHLRFVIFGGDKLEPAYLRDWLDIYPLAEVSLINMYGITETTVHVTFYPLTEADIRSGGHLSPVGVPLPETTLYIFNERLRIVPIGVRGEIYVGGSGVSVRGYLNKSKLTGERFIENPYKEGELLYKSGDLGRWLPDGRVDFCGRIDHQVKIRGFRIEPGEIENRLLSHEEVKDAVVTARSEGTGDRYLCGYIVLERAGAFESAPAMAKELRELLMQTLPDYMIPSFFVLLDRIPLTPNGKLDRQALPAPEVSVLAAGYTAPRDPVEKMLAEIWSEVLKVDHIGIDDSFFELGGHSLKATTLAAKIHKAIDVKVSLADLFRRPSIRQLAEFIKGERGDEFVRIESAEKKEYYCLSSAQKRLYVLQQAALESIGYNMPTIVRLEGILDKKRLESAFRKLIRRHESLRTAFVTQAGEPVQRIHDDVGFEIEYFKTENKEKGVEIQNSKFIIHNSFIRPFELSRAPLLRVGLIHTPALAGHPSQEGITGDKHILMVDMHHIITDGTSTGIIVKEFMAFYSYAGEVLPPLRIQYKDFSEWRNSELQRKSLSRQEAYWLKEFEGEIPLLDLITDYPRTHERNFEGHVIGFELSGEHSLTLKNLAKEENVTAYMVLLAIYNILLSKLSGQEEIIVGTPVSGRSHVDLEPLIGMFVNTLALMNYPGAEKTFRDFLKEIRARTLEAFENQYYPFEELVEKVSIDRDPNRNPLFDAMFALQNLDSPGLEIPGLRLKPYEFETREAKFDLCLTGMESGDKFRFIFEYRTGLFKEETIDEFINYFKDITACVLENRDIRLSDIEISIDLLSSDTDSDIYREVYEDFDF
jgi:amino acid adenylation domain-containing protein